MAQAPWHGAKRLEPLAGVRWSGDAEGSVLAGLALLAGRSGLPMGLDRPLPAPGIPGRCRSFIGGCWPRPLSCGGPGGFLSPLSTLRACLHGDGLCRYLGFAVIRSSPPSLGGKPAPSHVPQAAGTASSPAPLPACTGQGGSPAPPAARGAPQPPHTPRAPGFGRALPIEAPNSRSPPRRDQPRTLCYWTYADLPMHRPWGSGWGGSPLLGVPSARGPCQVLCRQGDRQAQLQACSTPGYLGHGGSN